MARKIKQEASPQSPRQDSLAYNEAYQRFISGVYDMREGAIASLRDADQSQTMAISGRIQAYDEVLSAGEWERVLLLLAVRRAQA